ncbi:flavodoxin family protein [Sphaerochaeta sp.]|uniref:flavodoxin family protein n=1 Tax=Sphaerochaeta sp. TaxID=1972642 RepID=UPI003D134E4F
MQMMIVYGSPKKSGNSATLAREFSKEACKQYACNEIYLQDLTIGPCRACNWCKTHQGCLIEDDMNNLCTLVKGADAILLATPVYWWGVSAQMKLFIDRLYQLKLGDFANKKLYVIATGEDSLDGVQYRLIREQFEAICEYTSMEFAGYLPVCADDNHPVQEQDDALASARELIRAE